MSIENYTDLKRKNKEEIDFLGTVLTKDSVELLNVIETKAKLVLQEKFVKQNSASNLFEKIIDAIKKMGE